jgi:hypothetical protein
MRQRQRAKRLSPGSQCFSAAQLGSYLRYALAVGLSGIQIALGDFVGWVVGAALRHHAAVGADAVDRAVVHRWLADPDHALLHRQRDEILNRRELVATGAC